jgi:signal transduction histidine kinase
MIDNLVSFATYFGQRRELLLDRADFGDTVSRAVDRLRPTATAKEVDIFLEIERPLPPVCGDHSQLGEAAHHLVDNAVKFTSAGGAVLVHCWAADECAHLEVRDTGIGVPPDRLPGLWEGFVQMADPLQRGVEGLGLGLALVRYVVTAHSGQVRAESKEGVGSMFGFRVPLDGPVHPFAESTPYEPVRETG